MWHFGRGLQMLGLVVLPVAMILEMSKVLGRSFGLNEMLLMLIFGAVVFVVGWMVAGDRS